MSTASATAEPALRGVNLAGAEFNAGRPDAIVGRDYVYPDPAALARLARLRMTAIRLPIAWERLQPRLSGDLEAGELGRLRAVIREASALGLLTIIDLHNYGLYRGAAVGTPSVPQLAFSDAWERIAVAFKDEKVAFGLMNEPHAIAPADWGRAAQAAVRAIRGTGARQLILLAGAGWSGAHDFVGGPESSAAVLADVADPGNALAIEVHQYLDADFSGTHATCRPAGEAARLLAPITAWARAHRRHLFLGEFGVSDDPVCLAGLDGLLGEIDAQPDVWIGWTAWAAGPWWGDYPLSLEPRAGVERPQMTVLRRHLPQK